VQPFGTLAHPMACRGNGVGAKNSFCVRVPLAQAYTPPLPEINCRKDDHFSTTA
jgi:hypothetical protein